MNHWVCRHAAPTIRSQRSITATTQIHQHIQPNRTLIPNPPRSSGVTIVGPTTAIATHTQPRRTIVPKTVATPLTPAVHQRQHRDGVDMPDAGLHPHRDAMHKQHTEPGPSCCVPFGDPHVHNVTPSDETRQECSHSSANTLRPVHHLGRTHHADEKSKGRKKEGVHLQRVLC